MTEEEQKDQLREHARALWAEDGQVEIDDDAEVSVVEGGAYVQAWVWVPKQTP